MPRDAREERRIRRHQDHVRRARFHHLSMRGLAALRSLHVTQVDEPEAIALGLEVLTEPKHTDGDRGVISNQRLGRNNQDLKVAGRALRAGNPGGDFETSLPASTDQDLALDQEGDGLLDGG